MNARPEQSVPRSLFGLGIMAVFALGTVERSAACQCIYPMTVTTSVSSTVVCYGSSLTITGSAHDADGLKKVELYVDNQKVCENTNPSYCVTVFIFDLSCTQYFASYTALGQHTAYTKAYDCCNNSKQSDPVTFKCIGGPIESLDSCAEPYGKYLLLTNPASQSPLETYRAKPGQPSGTTYKWEISSGGTNAHIEGSDTGSSVTLKADAEGDVTLKLAYTLGNTSCISYLYTAVQKPNQGNSSIVCDGWQWSCGGPGNPYMEATRFVAYYVRDVANRPVPHALWDETWAGGCNLQENDVYTDCAGAVIDTIWIWVNRYCDGDGVLCSDTQTFKVAGWPATGSFWTNSVTFNDGGGAQTTIRPSVLT